jgi:UDPglucose 6-dehydrogenase
MEILDAVESVNDKQKLILVAKICERYGENLAGKSFALWGLAFKPNTDDMRAAPSRVIIKELLNRGASVIAHDPVAEHEALRALELDFVGQPELLKRFSIASTPMAAVKEADALVIVTEWKAYRSPDFEELKQQLNHPVIFDGRNLYDPRSVLDMGFEYFGIGRSSLSRVI